MKRFFIFFFILLLGLPAQAQVPKEEDFAFEIGAHVGNQLPNQVPGVTEIFPQWGLRTGYHLSGSGFLEIGGTAGRGEGIEWSTVNMSLRFGVPLETLLAIMYIGGDLIVYKGEGFRTEKAFGGAHVGGGVMSLIADAVWFRADMKFNVNPGTSLYIGGGFMFRL